MHLSQPDLENQEISCFSRNYHVGITPMTTEIFIARSALFSKGVSRFAIVLAIGRERAPGHQTRRPNTHALAEYDGGGTLPATVKFFALFRAAQARYPLAHRPRFTSPKFTHTHSYHMNTYTAHEPKHTRTHHMNTRTHTLHSHHFPPHFLPSYLPLPSYFLPFLPLHSHFLSFPLALPTRTSPGQRGGRRMQKSTTGSRCVLGMECAILGNVCA